MTAFNVNGGNKVWKRRFDSCKFVVNLVIKPSVRSFERVAVEAGGIHCVVFALLVAGGAGGGRRCPVVLFVAGVAAERLVLFMDVGGR